VGRAADGLPGWRPASCFTADPVHGQSEGRLRGGQLRPPVRPLVSGLVKPGCLQGGADGEGRGQGRSPPSSVRFQGLAGWRDAGTGDRTRSGRSSRRLTDAQVCAARRGSAGGSKRTSAVRRTIEWLPGRRWLPDSPEPADHHGVSHPRVRRPGEPRLCLPSVISRMMTDPMKPPRAVLLADDDPRAHGRGRRPPVRRTVTQRLASPARPAAASWRPLGRSDSADRGTPLQTIIERNGFIQPLPDEGPPQATAWRARQVRSRTDPAIVTELIGRSQASIAASERGIRTKSGRGAARLHPGGHPGTEADLVRSAEPSGCSCRRMEGRRGGSTISCRRGWARRKRGLTRLRSPFPITSPRRWGWRFVGPSRT